MGFLPLGEVRKLGNRYDAFQCQALACLYQRSLPSPGCPHSPWAVTVGSGMSLWMRGRNNEREEIHAQ